MALYLDIHRNREVPSAEDVHKLHICDLEAQEKHGVTYLKYWFSKENGTICCLVDAPSKEAANAVHHDAHGHTADDIIEVESGLVDSFLGGGETDPVGAVITRDGSPEPPFRTILFTDLEGSTSLTQDRGDEDAMFILRKHDEIVRGALATFSGRKVKHTGDGIMASFISATAAIQCAITIVNGATSWNEDNPNDKLGIRIGISAGEPIEENKDLFGAAVQMAARVCREANIGEILVSNVVHDLCIGKKFSFQNKGDIELKGFPEPALVYAIEFR